MKILVLEDEYSIRSFIVLNLKREGYQVIETETGEEAIERFGKESDIRIAILDVMLPGIDGFEVLKVFRSQKPEMGIIMLTAKTQEHDKVLGLEFGADDYISKPFSPTELIARIRSLIRRLSIGNTVSNAFEEIRCGPFRINLSERSFFKNSEEVELTPKEFDILEYFMKNIGRSLSRDQILNEIWGKNYFGDLKVVDVNMRRIRKKIEADPANPVYLKTVWGHGYRWENHEI